MSSLSSGFTLGTSGLTMLGSSQCSAMQIEGLVWEVLLGLPTKSLMRFKCVSKLWYSIIRNPKFASAYSKGGLCGLVFCGGGFGPHCRAYKYFYLNLNDCSRLVRLNSSIRTNRVTRPVKGLMGLYDYQSNEFTLCNIATHELLELPRSPSYSDPVSINWYQYDIGFDPVKEVYKVLSGLLCYDKRGNFIGHQNHVFTLGVDYSDLKWRDIAPAPSSDIYCDLTQQHLCINGTMCWLPERYYVQENLIVFHLNNETFETIDIPDFCYGNRVDLVEICGSPALVVMDTSTNYLQMLDVWTMNNHCRGGELEAWTRKRVRLTTSSNIPDALYYVGTLPTGEVLLAQLLIHNFPFPIYIVDLLKNEVKSLIVENHRLKNEVDSLTIEDHVSQESETDHDKIFRYDIMECYQENIISLHSLMNNQKQD